MTTNQALLLVGHLNGRMDGYWITKKDTGHVTSGLNDHC
jgi:hypothetical protein